MNKQERVTIAGGGWAGLAAALELARHGVPVTLYESARQFGGRARSVQFGETVMDNGQHLLIGAYRETLRLLGQLGLDESAVLERQPLQLKVLDRHGDLNLSAPPLPAPLHLLWALLSARGLSLAAKARAVQMSVGLALSGYRLDEDCSVAALLARYRQPPELVRRFWEPLCLATLNTPLASASAQVFLRVLKDSFLHRREDADLLIPTVPLGELLAEPAAAHLGGIPDNRIETGRRLTALRCEGGRLHTIEVDGKVEPCPELILATPPSVTARLLGTVPETATQADAIGRLGAQPITTVYLYYPQAPALEPAMLGLIGTTSQWLFDRRLCGQPGWYAVVISSAGPHNDWSREELTEQVQGELAALVPDWPARAARWEIIREQRATFDCRVGIEQQRPDNATAIDGLWLAGDYTATGYPATLEGAVRSGVQCARRLLERRRNHP